MYFWVFACWIAGEVKDDQNTRVVSMPIHLPIRGNAVETMLLSRAAMNMVIATL